MKFQSENDPDLEEHTDHEYRDAGHAGRRRENVTRGNRAANSARKAATNVLVMGPSLLGLGQMKSILLR
jgi:hypothetical protein